MKATTEPPITAGQMKWLSDDELEQELTIAALNMRRPGRFDLLLAERDRRRQQRSGHPTARHLRLPHRRDLLARG